MFKKILLGLLVVIVMFVIVVAMQPADFKVTRSATIAAAPATVFEQVNNFQNWQAWSPWAKLDPEAKNTFEGPTMGEGAVYRWAGNSEVGEGSMTIVESRPGEKIKLKLDFVKPMEGSNDVLFTFKPEGNNTTVTWSMEGQKCFMAKAIGLFMDCDKMCGDYFEQGFSSIKTIVEKPTK